MVAQENVSSRVFQANNEVKAHFSVSVSDSLQRSWSGMQSTGLKPAGWLAPRDCCKFYCMPSPPGPALLNDQTPNDADHSQRKKSHGGFETNTGVVCSQMLKSLKKELGMSASQFLDNSL